MRQDDLARVLGTTQSSVSGWINGKYEPSAATVFKVETILGVDPGSLSRPLGYLPVEPLSGAVSVEGSIAQSALLGDEEKAALTSIYRLLAKTNTGAAGADWARNQPPGASRGKSPAGLPTSPARPRSVAGGH